MTPEQHLEHVKELAVVREQITNIAQDVSTVVSELKAINSLQRDMARFEQQQSDHGESFKRAFSRIEDAENAGRNLKQTTEKWINRGIGATISATILLGVVQYLVIERVKSFEYEQKAHGQELLAIDRRTTTMEFQMKDEKDRKGKH